MKFIEQTLKSALFRLDCPSNLNLGEYVLGVLDSSQLSLQIEEHTTKCPHCIADMAQIQRYMDLPLVHGSLIPDVEEEEQSLLDKVRVIIVDLLAPPQGLFVNPAMQPALRGARGDLATQVFQVESYIIALSAIKNASSWNKQQIIGDISPVWGNIEDFHHWSAYLWRNGKLLATTPLDRDSHFIFNELSLENEPHELILSGPKVEIHLQNIKMN